jgi:hypothetical protein
MWFHRMMIQTGPNLTIHSAWKLTGFGQNSSVKSPVVRSDHRKVTGCGRLAAGVFLLMRAEPLREQAGEAVRNGEIPVSPCSAGESL